MTDDNRDEGPQYTEDELAEMNGLMAEVQDGPNGIFGHGDSLVQRVEELELTVHHMRRRLNQGRNVLFWQSISMTLLGVVVIGLSLMEWLWP